MRMLHGVTLLLGLGVTAAGAQGFGPEPDRATRSEILKLREAAWRAFFAGDREAFEQVVPDELLAIGWGGGPWSDRAQTLLNMAEFIRSGQRLETLEFTRDSFQRYGEVVILYTAFRVVLVDSAGQAHTTAGRGTEIFVHRRGRWIHTGWHLDNTP